MFRFICDHATIKQQWHVSAPEVKKAQRIASQIRGNLEGVVNLHGKV
ncbi:MAG: hypothetical protein U0521_30275 [Anaerolineae bacterium]